MYAGLDLICLQLGDSEFSLIGLNELFEVFVSSLGHTESDRSEPQDSIGGHYWKFAGIYSDLKQIAL